MIDALFRAFGNLSDPRFRRYVWWSVGGAILVFVLLWLAVGWLLANTALTTIWWLDTVADVLGGLAVLVLSWLLFPGVVGLVAGVLLEPAADAVEARDYPNLLANRDQGWLEIVATVAKFAGIVIVANLIALPLYLVPVLNVGVFYALNGYLLGREYYELVAFRRLDPAAARALRRERWGTWFAAGVVIAFLMTVPFINLIMPLIATAYMVHVFENKRHKFGPTV